MDSILNRGLYLKPFGDQGSNSVPGRKNKNHGITAVVKFELVPWIQSIRRQGIKFGEVPMFLQTSYQQFVVLADILSVVVLHL